MRKVIVSLVLLAVASPAFALERAPRVPVRVEGTAKQRLNVERKQMGTVYKETVSAAKEVFDKTRMAAKADLKAKLAKIKDSKKRDAVQRIDDSMVALNKKTTDHYSDVLSKLSAVLGRVSERADRAAAKGVDVTAARVAITDSRTAITNAEVTVKAQASKVYSLPVKSEPTLKQDVGAVRQMLRNDLSALHDVVKNAQDSVRKAATTLAQTPRVNDEAPEVVPPAATSTSANNQ